MPNKSEHELRKIRGVLTSTNKLYTDTIASVREDLTQANITIKTLQSQTDNLTAQVKTLTTTAYTALQKTVGVLKNGDVILDGAFTPKEDATYSLGTGSKRWGSGHIDILNAGTLTAYKTRYIWIGSPHHNTGVEYDYGTKLVEGADDFAWYNFYIPSDFYSIAAVYAIFYGTIAGNNAYMSFYAKYGDVGEAHDLNAESDLNNAIPVVTTIMKYTCVGLLASAAVGDVGTLIVRRNAGAGDDTNTGDIIFKGFLIEYTASR